MPVQSTPASQDRTKKRRRTQDTTSSESDNSSGKERGNFVGYGAYRHENREPFLYAAYAGRYGAHSTPPNDEPQPRSSIKMNEVIEHLERMKKEFQKNKYNIYLSKKKELNQELQNLYDGSSTELQAIMKEFAVEQEKEEIRTKAYYKNKMENARKVHAETRDEIEREYKNICEENKKRLLSEIAAKRKLVEDDAYDMWDGMIPSHDPRTRSNKRNSNDFTTEGTNRKKIRTNILFWTVVLGNYPKCGGSFLSSSVDIGTQVSFHNQALTIFFLGYPCSSSLIYTSSFLPGDYTARQVFPVQHTKKFWKISTRYSAIIRHPVCPTRDSDAEPFGIPKSEAKELGQLLFTQLHSLNLNRSITHQSVSGKPNRKKVGLCNYFSGPVYKDRK